MFNLSSLRIILLVSNDHPLLPKPAIIRLVRQMLEKSTSNLYLGVN